MWKAGLCWLFCLWSLVFSFHANAGPPWCPVQIGTATYVSTGPTPGIDASTQALSAPNDVPGGAAGGGTYNMFRTSLSSLFGSDYCVEGIGSGTNCNIVLYGKGVENDLTTEDQLCPNPIKHTLRQSAKFGACGSDYCTRIEGGGERTKCLLGRADLHGHCVVNQCSAGTLAASGVYSLGTSQTNLNTSSCIQASSTTSPCEVTWQSTGAVQRRLVTGQTNYFQAGRYVQTGNLCTTNAGATPAVSSAAPSDTCGSGFDVYTDPATGIARCVTPGTGTPTPGDGTGAGAGSGGWPTTCPSWLSTVCGWFAETDSGAETLAAQKSGRVSDPSAPATNLPEQEIATHEQMVGATSPFFTGRYNMPTGCPANPEIAVPGGTFRIPYNQVCTFGSTYVHPLAIVASFIIALGLAFRGQTS